MTDNINMINSSNSNYLKNQELNDGPKLMGNEFHIRADQKIDTNETSKIISPESSIPPKILSNQNFIELDNFLSDL